MELAEQKVSIGNLRKGLVLVSKYTEQLGSLENKEK